MSMPSPIGHSLAGLAIARAGTPAAVPTSTRLYLAAAILARLPEIDLAFGYLIGLPRRFHHGPAHSLMFAIAIALLVTAVAPRIEGRRLRVVILAFACVASHGLLDMLRESDSPRSGVQYLWPFSQAFYDLPWHILYHAPELKQYTVTAAVGILFRNALAEITIIGPFTLLAFVWPRLRPDQRQQTNPPPARAPRFCPGAIPSRVTPSRLSIPPYVRPLAVRSPTP